MRRKCSHKVVPVSECLARFEMYPLETLKASDKTLSGELKKNNRGVGGVVFDRSFSLCESGSSPFWLCLSLIHIAHY